MRRLRATERGSSRQSAVDHYFDAQAPYWRDVYRRGGLQGLIYRQRMQTALGWIGELGASAGAAALEVGSGVGLVSVELARQGLRVTSTDASAEMTELTARTAEQEGLGDAVGVRIADAHDLPFATAQFELVVALGVLPWLHDPRRAVAEMARVLTPGGLLVLSADNRGRLNSLLGQNPLLDPFKTAYRSLRGHRPPAQSRMQWPRTVDRLLAAAGLDPVRRATIGFGPITFLGRPLLSEAASLRLHTRLQTLSDRGTPGIRRMGWHYVVAARKSAFTPATAADRQLGTKVA